MRSDNFIFSDSQPIVRRIGLAESIGFDFVAEFDELTLWQSDAREILRNAPGPRFLRVAVQATPREYLKFPTPPMQEQLVNFRAALKLT